MKLVPPTLISASNPSGQNSQAFSRECKKTREIKIIRRRECVGTLGNKEGSRTGKKEDTKEMNLVNLVSEPVVNESNVECQPKVWPDAPIIEEYESDSEDEHVSIPTKEQETPSFANHSNMTGKSEFTVAEYHDFKCGLVALKGSKGYKTGKGKGPTWLFDLDYLTDSMNYQTVRSENQANKYAGPQEANQNADELKRLKRQEKDANDEAEALRKETKKISEALEDEVGDANARIIAAVQDSRGVDFSEVLWESSLSFLDYKSNKKEDGIFISQDKYVAEILKKFDFVNVKTASTPIETQKPLVKDEEAIRACSRFSCHIQSPPISQCLEKTDGNAEFHEIIDFLTHSSIHHALTFIQESSQSPRPSPSTTILDSILESSSRNLGGHSSSDKSFLGNEGDMTLQSVYDLCISLCTQSMDEECLLMAKIGKKEILKEKLDAKGTEDAQDVGRTRDVVDKEKENAEDVLSTKDVLSTAQQKVSTDKEKVSTDGSKVSTARQKDSIDEQNKGTDDQIEGTDEESKDDETIAQVLLNMSQAKAVSREKEKGVEFKDIEETERPRLTSTRSLLTLKPLPKIDPKDKGKKKIEKEDESESESDGIPEAEKKFEQLASDEEMARKVQEEWEGEEEKKRLAKEEATNDALIRKYDDIKARIEADRLLAEKLKEEEREQFTVEERAKFLHDTIAAQRKFLAQQRLEAIWNRPRTKNQLRNQMMTYLKHVGNFKHSDLKTKKFEEIQALYEKIKRSDEYFISIGSAKDERLIKKINEKGINFSKTESVKEEDKKEEGTKKRKGGHIKIIARKKARKQSDVDSDDEHKKCLKIVTFKSILDSEIMEKKS
ncbi:hypothetical protein Tco_0661730, partial [Tanacetum coccineum]